MDICCAVSEELPNNPEENEVWNIGEIGWFTILCDNEEQLANENRAIIGRFENAYIKTVVAMDGNNLYINVMNRLPVDCDCDGSPAELDMYDIGILASYDPVPLKEQEGNGDPVNNLGIHYIWYYFEFQLRQVLPYWLLGIELHPIDQTIPFQFPEGVGQHGVGDTRQLLFSVQNELCHGYTVHRESVPSTCDGTSIAGEPPGNYQNP